MFVSNSKFKIDLGMCQPGKNKYQDEFGDYDDLRLLDKFMLSQYNIIPQQTFIGLGATGCLFHILKSLPSFLPVYIDKRYYVDYPGIIHKSGHDKVIFDHLRNIKYEPGIYLINFPNNPTGLDASDEDVEILKELSNKEGVFIILDSVYARLFPDSRTDWQCEINNAVLVESLSKTNCACGSRFGWASFYNCDPIWLDKYLTKLRSSIRYDHVCPPRNINLDKMLGEGVTDFSENRKMMSEILKKHNIGAYTFEPKSLFILAFIDPKVQSKLMLEGVNFVTHNEFGSQDINEVRLTYAVPQKDLKKFDEILTKIMG